MLNCPMDVLHQFPIRKTKKQKQAFRDAVRSYVTGLGYDFKAEKGSLGSVNIVIGDPERADYLVTAHYDTCAHLPFPNLITPCNLWFYLGYQLLLLVPLIAISVIAGWLSHFVFDDPVIPPYIGLAAYWIALIAMMTGPANKHNANDNTSGVVTVLEMLRTMPQVHRSKVCFVLFDLEEAGMWGSASYRSQHKSASERQLVLNLDCVGDGDEIVMFPSGKLKKKAARLDQLGRICGTFGKKTLTLHQKGFAIYPSDQTNFPYGVGIAAFNRSKHLGLYCDKIHTNRDTVLDQTNVNILRAALTTLISGNAVQ